MAFQLVGLADSGRARSSAAGVARLEPTAQPDRAARASPYGRDRATRNRESRKRATRGRRDRLADRRAGEERSATPAEGCDCLGDERDRLRPLVLGLRPRRTGATTPAEPAAARLSVSADGERGARRG